MINFCKIVVFFTISGMKTDPRAVTFSEILRSESFSGEQLKGNRILSYRFPVEITNFEYLAQRLIRENNPVFYFEKPQGNYRFLAIGSIRRFRSGGARRFEEVARAVSGEISHVVQNYNGTPDRTIPLLVGSMSFFPEHRDRIWDEFYPSDWFIPEFIIHESGGKPVVSYQVDLSKPDPERNSVRILRDFIARLNNVSAAEETKTVRYRRIINREEKENWIKKAAGVVESIKKGDVNKVVLSRSVKFDAPEKQQIIKAVLDAGDAFSAGYLFLLKSNESLFIGVSPEKLASFEQGNIHCHAIAGSVTRGTTEQEDNHLGDELLSSKKNREEHQVVVNHIQSILEKYCSRVTVDPVPALKKMSYIQHLYTGISGELSPGVSMFRILEDLHPTPAVGGYPLSPALTIIRDSEQYDRGLYAGFLGWFDANTTGDFCVALRSALYTNNKLYAFAGSGIMRDSDPRQEFEKTEVKLNAITSLMQS